MMEESGILVDRRSRAARWCAYRKCPLQTSVSVVTRWREAGPVIAFSSPVPDLSRSAKIHRQLTVIAVTSDSNERFKIDPYQGTCTAPPL